MIFEELSEDLENIKKSGSKISPGFTSRTLKNNAQTTVAQYPAERSAGNDTSQDMRVYDLYQNGLLFTAYDYNSRTTPDLRDFRAAVTNSSVFDSPSKTNTGGQAFTKLPVANILLPRSKSDVDTTSHKFNDVGESLITKGGGSAMGILSNVASTAVFGAIESITGGMMADHGEQLYNTARSMYAGADNRTKVFTWDLTPRSPQDLIQIVKIYEIFNYYSYGTTGISEFSKDVKDKIDEWYKSTLKNYATPENAAVNNTLFEDITSFLSNVIVVSNPTIWTVRNFGYNSSYDGREDIFGPCQIQSIRFDKTPNGHFNGLAIAPNLPSTFTLEITMREILTLNRNSVYTEGF